MAYRCGWNWFGILVLVGVLPLATAMAQFDPDLELREFEGSPRMVRVQGVPVGSSAELFRVYHLDADGRINFIYDCMPTFFSSSSFFPNVSYER